MSDILIRSADSAPRQDALKSQIVSSDADHTRPRSTLVSGSFRLKASAAQPSRRIAGQPRPSAGSLSYLAFVALVAVGIIAIFFGTGLSLLVSPPAPSGRSDAAVRHGPAVIPLQASFAGGAGQGGHGETVVRENEKAVQGPAALPAAVEPSRAGREENARPGVKIEPATPQTSAAPGLAPPGSGLPSAEMTELLEHGDALLRTGDLASARLFYERAASSGDGRAALRLGATFDPLFLGRLGLGKLQSNAAEARSWYSRALELGIKEAARPLSSLETGQGK